jgi:hypothetical protein
MTGSDPLETLRHRAARHACEDGTIDLVLGVFTLMVGVATQRRIWLVFGAVYLGLMYSFWKVLHYQLTSQRTGYAEIPGDPPRRLFSVILLAGFLTMGVVAALTLSTGALWSLDQWPTWTPVMAGLILAAGFLHTAVRTALTRYYLYVAVSIGASLFFWLYAFGPRINPSDRLTLFLFAVAAVQVVVGAVTTARFVRSRPVVPQEVSSGQ